MKLRLGAWSLAALAIVFVGCTTPEKPPPPTSPPVITSFTVDKTKITKGESVSFTIAAERGKSASIIDQTGAEIAVTFDAAAGTGTATATPSASAFYILHVDGDGGRDTAFVQVAVDEGLKSIFLVVVPQEVKAGESVDVLWSAVGGQNISLTAGQTSLSMDPSGSLVNTPTTSTTYTLSAQKLDGSMLTASVDVKVMPVIKSFEATPPVAQPGETITLNWTTAGGERVVLSEATFGQVADDATNVDTGSATFTVPYYQGDAGLDLDGGLDPDAGTPTVPVVRDGLPLRFTLTLSTATPAQSVSRAIDGRVGQGPIIDAFDVPAFATNDKTQTISWQTTNATRVELYADGLLVAAPRAGQSLDGSFTVPPITAATEFMLVAYDFNGLSVSKTGTVTPVQPPSITSFTTPPQVSSAGSAIAAAWQTSNATSVVIRIANGPNLFFSDVANEVGMGTHDLRVAATTTFVLEAYNSAGDVVTATSTTTVATPAGITFSPDPSGENTPLTAQWDVSSLGAIDLPGLPGLPQVNLASTNFIDLDTVPAAKALYFENTDDGSATFTAPGGFVFPFVTSRAATFTASTNGALVLGSGGASSTNADVGAADYAGPALLAPFWDDLDLGSTGSVKYYLDGAQFPRTLIVQWSKAGVYGVAGTELTFQVQLSETGKFLFVYKTLTGTDTDSATIGAVESPKTFQHAVSFDTAGALTEGQETVWFANELARVIGTQPLTLASAKPFGFFVENASNQLVAVQGTPRVFAANSVLVNEVMPVPNGAVPMGQWIELFNTTSQTINLDGLELVSATGSATPYALSGLSIDAGAYLVLGQSTDPLNNGEANVSVAWGASDLPMADADAVTLQVPGSSPFTVSTLSWTGGPADGGVNSAPGESVQPAERAIMTSSTPLTCTRTKTFGSASQVGTPAAVNETCFEYTVTPIGVDYVDISASGTPLFPFGSSMDSVYTNDGIDLPAPFKYFGTDYTRAWISANGFLSFTSLTSSYNGNVTTTSATRAPQGTIAVFWDDLKNKNGVADANVYVGRVGAATIIQWHHFSYWTPADDDMNFEVKLFDNGIIEFHYATMISASSTNNYAAGTSATAWLEKPGAAEALPLFRNSGASTATNLLSPNTAFRFTPKP